MYALRVILFPLLLLLGLPVSASIDLGERLSAKGLLDFRLQYFDGGNSWLDGGVGLSRFDQSHNGSLLLADAAIELKADLAPSSQIIVQAHGYPNQTSGLEITEAYWQYRPLNASGYRSRYRLGAFYPAISLENRGPVWTSRYGLNYSEINTWIAEELRTVGAEGSWTWRLGEPGHGQTRINIKGALFGYNDPVGTVLAWKGWSNHDRQTGIGKRLPFTPGPGVAATANVQAPAFEPFMEIDNALGFYLSSSISKRKKYKLEAFYYDNRAKDIAFEDGQYAWATRFYHVSGHYFIDPSLEVFSQYIRGNTSMGQGFVDNDFESIYLTVSKRWNKQRISLRAEHSNVKDKDNTPKDSNGDTGNSYTLSYSVFISMHWKLGAEYNLHQSKQPRRLYRSQPVTLDEKQFSISARWYF